MESMLLLTLTHHSSVSMHPSYANFAKANREWILETYLTKEGDPVAQNIQALSKL
jgi:hypothetical protein